MEGTVVEAAELERHVRSQIAIDRYTISDNDVSGAAQQVKSIGTHEFPPLFQDCRNSLLAWYMFPDLSKTRH